MRQAYKSRLLCVLTVFLVHKCKINIQNSKYIKDKTPQSSPILQKNIDVNFTEMLGDLDLKLHNSLSLVELGKNIKEKEDEE